MSLTYESDNDDLLCIGDTVLLVGDGAETYTYNDIFNDPLVYQMVPKVRLSIAQNIFYVTGFDEHGCANTADVTIWAETCCDIIVPTAFSPNGDGLNDKFGALTLGHPEN